MSEIGYYKREDIDTTRWDNCIDSATNGLIYARSLFLDCMCDHWDALILGDYEVVMPVPWKRKFGISYVYQPAFCQQLGIFGTSLSAALLKKFLQEFRNRFLFGELSLNFNNPIENAATRINYCLDLAKHYLEIQQGFKSSLRNHVRKAESFGLKYEYASDLQECIHAVMNEFRLSQAAIKNQDLHRFKSLCEQLGGSNSYIIRNVTNESGEVLSRGLLLLDSNRLYNIFSITSDRGRTMRSNHFLLTNLIREFSDSSRWLDFEGSMLPGVKTFFESFGAFNQPYYFFRHNSLPFPFRLIRK